MSAARWDPNEVMNVISKSHSDDFDPLIEEGIYVYIESLSPGRGACLGQAVNI